MSIEIKQDGEHRIVTASHDFEHNGAQVCRVSVAITDPARGDQYFIDLANDMAALRAEKFIRWMQSPPTGLTRQQVAEALGVIRGRS